MAGVSVLIRIAGAKVSVRDELLVEYGAAVLLGAHAVVPNVEASLFRDAGVPGGGVSPTCDQGIFSGEFGFRRREADGVDDTRQSHRPLRLLTSVKLFPRTFFLAIENIY